MAYIHVDIDLDEIDTYELVDEVVKRLKRAYGRKDLTKEQRQELKESATDLLSQLCGVTDVGYPNNTLEDKMKKDVILSVWDKYSSWQLEQKLSA